MTCRSVPAMEQHVMSSTSDSARYDATFMRWVRQTHHHVEFNHSPSKTDECPPNIYNMNVCMRTVNLGNPLVGRSMVKHTHRCDVVIVRLRRCEFNGHIGRLFVNIVNCMLSKRRFCKGKQKMKSGFSHHFSRAWVLDLGYSSLKSAAKILISSFVHPCKIFVWGE